MLQTFKQCLRAIRSVPPYKHLPHNMIIEAVAFTNFWLNTFPPKTGISTTHCSRNIVLGSSLSQHPQRHMSYGVYTEVHYVPESLNLTDTAGTTLAICLGPTGDARGSYNCINLRTGHVILCNQFTEMPSMPNTAGRVNHLANNNGQDNNMTFRNLTRTLIPDSGQQAHRHQCPTTTTSWIHSTRQTLSLRPPCPLVRRPMKTRTKKTMTQVPTPRITPTNTSHPWTQTSRCTPSATFWTRTSQSVTTMSLIVRRQDRT